MELSRDAQVTVIRTGGVAGVRLEATVAWAELDDDVRSELTRVLDREGGERSPGADRLAYEIVVREAGSERACVAGEGARHAAEAVLRSARR